MPGGKIGREAGVALTYAAAVFGCGFILGTIRVLALAPRLGDVAAVAAELPIMLGLSWVIGGRVLKPVRKWAGIMSGLRIGVLAFALLQLLELALSAGAFGRPIAAYLAQLATPAGLIGLAGQLGFSAIPWLRLRGGA